jgi:broad specificity phosphatase PhoE
LLLRDQFHFFYTDKFFMASRLLLIRHAETDAAQKKLLVGSTEVSAGEEGLERLDRFRRVLEPYTPAEWFCSPMKRALQTAERIVDVCGLDREVRVDDRLREIDFGRWEMRSFADISLSDPDLVDDWAGYDGFVFPGGEAVSAFQGRVSDVLSALHRLPAKEVCVVTHGGVIRAMICLALGKSPADYLLYSVRPGTLTVLDLYPEGGVLAGLNV